MKRIKTDMKIKYSEIPYHVILCIFDYFDLVIVKSNIRKNKIFLLISSEIITNKAQILENLEILIKKLNLGLF